MIDKHFSYPRIKWNGKDGDKKIIPIGFISLPVFGFVFIKFLKMKLSLLRIRFRLKLN